MPDMNSLHVRTLCLLFTILSFVACSGGNSDTNSSGTDGNDSSVPDLLVGRFVDGPVSGLLYSTPTNSGKTNANGEFFYQPGENISFSVGDIIVGQALGASTISPFDLAKIAPPQTGTEIRLAANRALNLNKATLLEVAANIAVFLQTLDEDADPSNGIKIPTEMHNLSVGANLNFKQEWWKFARNTSFRRLVEEGKAAGLWGGDMSISNDANAVVLL